MRHGPALAVTGFPCPVDKRNYANWRLDARGADRKRALRAIARAGGKRLSASTALAAAFSGTPPIFLPTLSEKPAADAARGAARDRDQPRRLRGNQTDTVHAPSADRESSEHHRHDPACRGDRRPEDNRDLSPHVA